MFSDKINKAQGCLIGAASGDSLGMPTENISRTILNQNYGGRITHFQRAPESHPCAHLKEGQYTDDTQQLIILAQSIDQKRGLDFLYFAEHLGKWAYNCVNTPCYNRFAGGTSLLAGMQLYEGKSPLETGQASPSCGSAMRTAPLGVYYYDQPEKIPRLAALVSQVTHSHPAAIEASVFLSTYIAYLMLPQRQRKNKEKIIHFPQDTRLANNLCYAAKNKEKSPEEIARVIGVSQSVYETVPMALYCFLHSPNDFEQTIINAANLVPGDTDSIACIAGALSGTHNGLKAIPDRFKNKVEDAEMLRELGKRLIRRKWRFW